MLSRDHVGTWNVTHVASFVARTEYDWDSADNRLEKREYANGLIQETTVYTPNNLVVLGRGFNYCMIHGFPV